jgi:hypothetical protein
MRFSTQADWRQFDDGRIEIYIAETDWRYMACYLMHELTEIFICQKQGVTGKMADAFDSTWEEELKQGKWTLEQEPGCDKRCPYFTGHKWGIRMERLFCFLLGVKWKKYNYDSNKLLNPNYGQKN